MSASVDQGVDVQSFIDESPLSRFQVLIILLCFLTVAADGFDTAAIGFIGPALRAHWKLDAPQLAPLFAAGLFGLMAGALVFGPLADRIGRKAVLVATTVAFGLASMASANADSLDTLIVWRFVTGLGLGGAMPSAITLTSEFCPAGRRSLLVTTMFCGFAIGSAVGGLASAGIVAAHGWPGVLVLGGVLPLVLALALAMFLPESVRYLVLKGGRDEQVRATLRRIRPDPSLDAARFIGVTLAKGSPVKQLFAPDLLAGTVLLWLCFFSSLLVFYLLTSWLPTLLNSSGQSLASASLIALMLPVGSTFGALTIGLLMDRISPYAVLGVSYLLAAVFIALLGLVTTTPWLLVVAVFGSGIGTGGSQVGINALAAAYYPTANRATGVSWANGLGRAGSVMGSAVGGYLLHLGWPLSTVFLTAAVPAVVAGAAIYAMGWYGRALSPTAATDPAVPRPTPA